MDTIQQLKTMEINIRSNIESIQRLVDEAEKLKNSIATLEGEKKKIMEQHLQVITEIINKLATQTIEMFSAFREFVK